MTRALVIACAILALCLSAALVWGYRTLGKAQVQATTIDALEKDLAALEATLQTIQANAHADASQAAQRTTLRQPVKQAAKAVKQGVPYEDRPRASDAQLDRLRALAAEANAAAASASELP